MDKIIIVFDLGPGDGGKGGVIHALACANQTRVVFKVGGAQGSHGVKAGRNEFAFSQWGCGTFEGIPTHVTQQMIISPEGLLNEADGLRYHGVTNAFNLLTVDERALCATPYHGITSRIIEIVRGFNSRGTIGTGVGEAFRNSHTYPDLAIRANDLKNDLRCKLKEIRDLQIETLAQIPYENVTTADDHGIIEDQMGLLTDPGFLDHCVEQFREAGRQTKIVDADYMDLKFFAASGTGIVESSHGVLTDNLFGFRPHVSAIRTLPEFAEDMLKTAGFQGIIEKIGVHRAYTIRHGAGPMPTADPSLNDSLLPGSHKQENRWQGKVRVGPLDFVLLRYAIEVCGGHSAIDGLAVSWFDQIATNGVWPICDRYSRYDEEYFRSENRIRVFAGVGIPDYQQKLCSSLFACKAEISTLNVPTTREEQFQFCDDKFHAEFGIPVQLLSFGPSEQDKLIKDKVA